MNTYSSYTYENFTNHINNRAFPNHSDNYIYMYIYIYIYIIYILLSMHMKCIIPIIMQLGRRVLMASAMPAISPAPPTGITTTSKSGTWICDWFCVCACVCVCVCACAYAWTYTYVHEYLIWFISKHVYVCKSVRIPVHVSKYTLAYVHTHTHKHVYIYTHILYIDVYINK